jgi:hypothetical protein
MTFIGKLNSFCYDSICKHHHYRGENIMIPAKEEVRQLLAQLPDNTTMEDIQYHIYVRQKIDLGLDDIASGKTLTEAEFDSRMNRWLEP